MEEEPLPKVAPFVFSAPAGKRWPRLRLILLLLGIVVFVGPVLFVQTLFVAPQLNLPFSLRQLKGQLKALQTVNPAGQTAANLALWEKFAAARIAGKKPKPPIAPTPPAHPRKKSPANEVHLAFYANGDPYSYTPLEQHAGQITHVCLAWMAMTGGAGDLQLEAVRLLAKLGAIHRIRTTAVLINLL